MENVGVLCNKFQELPVIITHHQVQVDNYSSLIAAEQQSIETSLVDLTVFGGASHQQLAEVLGDL